MKKLVLSSVLALFSTSSFAETIIEMQSDAGDYIGLGQSYSYDASNAYISFSRNYDNGISIRIDDIPDQDESFYWRIDLAAPNDSEITPGLYANAERFPFQEAGNPGLSVSGNGRGCNTVSGEYEVFEVSYDASGEVESLGMSFEHHCGTSVPAMRGEIYFNTNPPVGVSGINLTATKVVCRNDTTGKRARVFDLANSIDCKAAGLVINPGDQVRVVYTGIAE